MTHESTGVSLELAFVLQGNQQDTHSNETWVINLMEITTHF